MPSPTANGMASASQFNWLDELDRSLELCGSHDGYILEVLLWDKEELQQSDVLATQVIIT